jgi:hypothetical protein
MQDKFYYQKIGHLKPEKLKFYIEKVKIKFRKKRKTAIHR